MFIIVLAVVISIKLFFFAELFKIIFVFVKLSSTYDTEGMMCSSCAEVVEKSQVKNLKSGFINSAKGFLSKLSNKPF